MPGPDFSQQDANVEVQRWVPSTCGVCSIGCGVDIGVAGGRIVGVRGRAEHPVSHGRLGPKGLNQYFANRHPSRATHSLVRNGSGKLVRASWDEAMQRVVDRVNETLTSEGPDGVGIYNSGQLLLEEYYTLGKIARAGLGLASIGANTRLCTATTASSLMESFGADGPPGAFEDLEQTECIVLVGHNAAEQNGKQANVEQLATPERMQGGTPDERGGLRKALTRIEGEYVRQLFAAREVWRHW